MIDAVAARLGNTRAIARSSYVSPRVINHYMEGSVISYYSERIEEVSSPSRAASQRERRRY